MFIISVQQGYLIKLCYVVTLILLLVCNFFYIKKREKQCLTMNFIITKLYIFASKLQFKMMSQGGKATVFSRK